MFQKTRGPGNGKRLKSHLDFLDLKKSRVGELRKMARNSVLTEKQTQILKMWESGSTLDQIGRQFGVTRERIRQILKKLRDKGYSVLDRAEQSSARRKRNLDAVLVHEREIISKIAQRQAVP